MALRDLGDAQLWQLMEDLWQEVAHRELSVSPRSPPLGCWRTPMGNRDPNVEDEEVTFLGGRGWGPSGQLPWPTGPLKERTLGMLSVPLPLGCDWVLQE